MLTEVIPKTYEIINSAFDRFDNLGVAFSGGSDSVVLLHLILPIQKDIPVVFVNTYHQFKETYQYIKELREEWNLNIKEFKAPTDKYSEFKNRYNDSKFYEVCCKYHKIQPLLDSIKTLSLDGLFVGIRGVEHEERAKETYFSKRETHTRIHPLLDWNRQDIIDYLIFSDIKINPMYDKGYTSLGCDPCTFPNPDPTKHERFGREQKREIIMRVLREAGYT